MTPTRPLRVAAISARTPGSITPTTGTSRSACSSSSAAAEAVLHATTTQLHVVLVDEEAADLPGEAADLVEVAGPYG